MKVTGMNDTGDNHTDTGSRPREVLDVGALEALIENDWIARRAYEIYESRGSAPGHANDDWLRAERESAARHATRERDRKCSVHGSAYGHE
jgi:hypothetical protein